MSALIPLIIGLAMVVNPQLFYRLSGAPTLDTRSRARFQKIGYGLVAVAFVLFAAKLLQGLVSR